jgi:two-component system, LytTR family, sensor kinase
MKPNCEGCQRTLPSDAEAYVCSYECTFCTDCALRRQRLCPHCGGELVRRPRRVKLPQAVDHDLDAPGVRAWLVWTLSFGVWTFIALAYTITIYEVYRSTGGSMRFLSVLGMQCSQVLTYIPLSPFVFAFANRYPLQRSNWAKRSLLLLAGGLVFTVGQVALRGITPYAYWDPRLRHFVSAIWDSQAHGFRIQWHIYESLFLSNVVDDVFTTYLPIILIAHVVSYYQRFRQRELRASQLQTQLAKAHLQVLKSQLQPHFLFNTMHSISALMLTDVQAADRMMTRLSDLLRMSLEAEGTQVTTLSHELEFVNCYLEIEKIRFEERLNVILDISPETLDAQVPQLLLQPLVDNAVKHGISRLPGEGEIRIIVKEHRGELQLEVSDNGPGFGKPSSFQPSGLGLRITRERLESLYGQDQSMELLSPPEGGARVRICIPFRAQPGEIRPALTLTALGQNV